MIKHIEKYSFGTGDRFAKSASAQLRAVRRAAEDGIDIGIVWNKSNREHKAIGSTPESTVAAGEAAVRSAGWRGPYHFDADHINRETVGPYLRSCDFFTLDVADSIGREADESATAQYLTAAAPYIGRDLTIPGMGRTIRVDRDGAMDVARKYLFAVMEARAIYERILEERRDEETIIEVSMDETDAPQTPEEVLFILLGLAWQKVPLQTFAPRFSGRFNKGVDYVGEVDGFAREFEEDLLVLRYAAETFGLPTTLKLSVHSGSDKFSIYPAINRIIRSHDAGLHLKTAGTSWLEEVIGLAWSGGDGLAFVIDLYAKCVARIDELCAPYLEVIDIDRTKLPAPDEVLRWDGERFARTLTHNQDDALYNPSFRQLIHVGYKVAAEDGPLYTGLLDEHRETVDRCVADNLFERHIKKIFY
ncbi:MAG: tagaturonate epimerase family protein [Spirochaetales bacterium]|nr:tagaturonate epimerase family protein [Spirochaetales bacterium]